MRPEDFFDFDASREIKLKGHRIWLHHVVMAYQAGATNAAQLLEQFPSLDYPKIDACLTYYSQHKDQLDRYLAEMREEFDKVREQQRVELAPLIERMRLLAKERRQETIES